jgi:quinol monooxygenase YgiN
MMILQRLAAALALGAAMAACQTPPADPAVGAQENAAMVQNAGMILITGTVVVAPENREAMIALGREQVTNSRSEEGNVSYGFYEDALQPNTFIFVERWRDQAAVGVHFAKPYSGAFVQKVRAIALNAPAIEIHDIAGQRTVIPGG